jgi:aminomethyltransferase
MKQQLLYNWQGKDIRIEYIEDRSLIALQGPKAAITLQSLVSGKLDSMNFMTAAWLKVPKIEETVLVSRCGYTGKRIVT